MEGHCLAPHRGDIVYQAENFKRSRLWCAGAFLCICVGAGSFLKGKPGGVMERIAFKFTKDKVVSAGVSSPLLAWCVAMASAHELPAIPA
eukprot:1161236-Pelagomonas_calceolata.AAC.3